MNDFHSLVAKNPNTGEVSRCWWVDVLGKGNKRRSIPVPDQLVTLIREYRQALNHFPHRSRVESGAEDARGTLSENFGEDDSAVIRNLSGNLGITTNRLQVSVKNVLLSAVEYYKTLKEEASAPPDVDVVKLGNASAHWMRHTSATHQGYGDIEDGQLQLNLGHASIDTTRIYKHEDDALRATATRGFTV